MMKRVLLTAALSLSVASPALAASILYGTDNAATYTINTTTGVATLIGSNGLSGFGADGYGTILRDLTSTPSKLYGAQWTFASTGITGAVATVDAVTGAVTASASLTGLLETGFNQGLYSLAFDTSTNTLYGNTARRLYTIDPATGATTFVGDLVPGSIVGLGIDASTGTLFSISQIVDATGTTTTTLMRTLSKSDGSILSTVTLGNQCACDIAFDPLTNQGYISSYTSDVDGNTISSQLDALNSSFSGTTIVGSHGAAAPFGMSGLAFFGTSAPVPEATTWAMMITGFGLAGFSLRRSKRIIATV